MQVDLCNAPDQRSFPFHIDSIQQKFHLVKVRLGQKMLSILLDESFVLLLKIKMNFTCSNLHKQDEVKAETKLLLITFFDLNFLKKLKTSFENKKYPTTESQLHHVS